MSLCWYGLRRKTAKAKASFLERLVRWPSGKYNGRRIGGFQIDFKLNILGWWKIKMRWCHGEPYLRFGPVYVCFKASYE